MPQNQPDSTVLRDSLTREVTNDAYAISQQIFKGQEPDVARVDNEELDTRYYQAILNDDRRYLMSEAARDPSQFMASMQRLIDDQRAFMPPGSELDQQGKLPQAAKANVPLPKPPQEALPQPIDPNAPPPPSAPPVPPSAPSAAGLVPPPSPPSIKPGTVPNVTGNAIPPAG